MASSFKRENINTIADRYGVDLLVYFGSYRTEYYHEESDIDIAFLRAEESDSQL